MRRWDVRRDAETNTWELCVDDDGKDARLVIAEYQRGIDLRPYLDFIVDACNVAEARQFDAKTGRVLREAMEARNRDDA